MQVDFLIILRNQYDLIKSIFIHSHATYNKFLGVKKFEELIKKYDTVMEDSYKNFGFSVFANSYNFYKIYSQLKSKFTNSEIKFLFFEDLEQNRDNFANEFSSFLNLENSSTNKLFIFDNNKINKIKKVDDSVYETNTEFLYELSKNKSQIYQKIKKFLPNNIKKYLKRFLSLKVKVSQEQDIIFKNKVKDFYKDSNSKFFKATNLINKFNY